MKSTSTTNYSIKSKNHCPLEQTSKLFCGKCKAMMTGESGTSHTEKTYRYYKCVNQKRKHTCDKKPISKDKIENLVIKAVAEKIMDDEVMEQLADTLYEIQMRENIKIPQLKERIAETVKGINNMLDAIQQGIILESTKQRLSDLEEQKKTLELQLLQEEIASPTLTRDQILFGLTKFRKLDLSTREGKQILVDSFINSIYLYDDCLIITCNYKDGTLKIPLGDIEGSDLFTNGVPKIFQTPLRLEDFLFERSEVYHHAIACISSAACGCISSRREACIFFAR